MLLYGMCFHGEHGNEKKLENLLGGDSFIGV